MFQIFVALCSGICAQNIQIVRQIFDIDPIGNYNYAFETGNQIYVEEQGFQKDQHTHVKQGQYQFTSPEGKNIRVGYTADENGFQPQGADLPTPPPVPPLIKKALDYLSST